MQEYTLSCFEEHNQVINNILSLGYRPRELCFRDYLSGPRNEIDVSEVEELRKAFESDMYELIPTILFANQKLENPSDGLNETSGLTIEFHRRGMAF